jgi:long-subunit acyl-CoA synthetase (AMP-forming)
MIDVAPPLRPIPDTSIHEFVASNPYGVELDTVVYIDYHTGRQITFQSYLEFAQQLASGLRHPAAFKTPLKYGDRVQIVSPNFVRA